MYFLQWRHETGSFAPCALSANLLVVTFTAEWADESRMPHPHVTTRGQMAWNSASFVLSNCARSLEHAAKLRYIEKNQCFWRHRPLFIRPQSHIHDLDSRYSLDALFADHHGCIWRWVCCGDSVTSSNDAIKASSDIFGSTIFPRHSLRPLEL